MDNPNKAGKATQRPFAVLNRYLSKPKKKRIHNKLGTSVSKELFYDPETSRHNTKGVEKNVYSVDRYYSDPSADKSKPYIVKVKKKKSINR